MAGTVYISEAEAARDFAAVMRLVRAGDEVVVEDAAGPVAVLRSASADGEPDDPVQARGKTASEVIEGFGRWESEHGSLEVDEDFANDMDEIVASRRHGARPAARTVDQARALLAGRSKERHMPEDDPERSTRSLGEVIDGLRRREAEQGLATADDEFAADMERVHRELNLPMDSTKWD